MNLFARVFTTVICALCVLGLANPVAAFSFADSIMTPAGVWIIAIVRVALGVLLIGAAQGSRAPRALMGFGVFVILAGIATPLVGAESGTRMIEWLSARGDVFLRTWMVFGLMFWLLVLYGLTPRPKTSEAPAGG